MTDTPNTSVVRNDASARYEILLADAAIDDAGTQRAVAGFAAFHESETHIAFTHTEVDEAYKGKGLASRLAETALADAVARDLTIIPICPYMAKYLERHPIEGARVEWPKRAPRP